MKAHAAATPIVLIVLAVGAAAYAYLADRGTVPDAERAERRREVFPSFRLEEVTRLQLDRGGEKLVLERDKGAGASAASAWVMTSPRRDPADSAGVEMLLRELEVATRLRDVEGTTTTGLDAPRVRGLLNVGPLEYRFSLGAEAPRPEGAAYMRLEGESTFVVGRSLKAQLLRGADAYRERTLVPLGASEVARLEVRAAGGGGFALERSGATFRIVGTALRASRTAADRIFAALADARAETFLHDGDADLATEGRTDVMLVPRDPGRPRVELRLGAPCAGRPDDVAVLRTLPTRTLACTSKSLAQALNATSESLVDASVLFAHADEIEEVRLENVADGGSRLELARKARGWHERAPQDRDLEPDQSDLADGLALALANAQAIDARRLPAREPLAVLTRATVVRTGGGSSEVVELAAPGADGATLAHRLDDGAVLRLSRAVARRFEPHPAALRPRAVWTPPFDAAAVVAIEDGCVPGSQRLEMRDRTWTMRSPAGFAADPVSVTDLTGAIARAKADAWVAERDDGTFGFDRPGSCAVSFMLDPDRADGAGRHPSLIFGGEVDGGIYAHTLDDPAIFIAPRILRELVSHPAIDRSRIDVDPAALARVTLVREGVRLVLEQSGGRLLRPDRPGDTGTGDDRLESALAGLHAQTAVHTGPPARDEGMDRPTLEIIEKTAPIDGRGTGEAHLTVGAAAHVNGADICFVRVSGVNATFAVPHRAVSAILDAW
jgi:hypothetical protein